MKKKKKNGQLRLLKWFLQFMPSALSPPPFQTNKTITTDRFTPAHSNIINVWTLLIAKMPQFEIHVRFSFKILFHLWKKKCALMYKEVNKFLILFQLIQVHVTRNFLWRCKWQVISSIFLLRIWIIRNPDQNLISIFSGLRYAQTFSWRWLNNLQSAFN